VCDTCNLKYKYLPSADAHSGEFATHGVDVIFRISIPSAERTALLLQSTGTCKVRSFLLFSKFCVVFIVIVPYLEGTSSIRMILLYIYYPVYLCTVNSSFFFLCEQDCSTHPIGNTLASSPSRYNLCFYMDWLLLFLYLLILLKSPADC